MGSLYLLWVRSGGGVFLGRKVGVFLGRVTISCAEGVPGPAQGTPSPPKKFDKNFKIKIIIYENK